jgi:uncharacterized membrane protein YphA (DoxX/SURF4 family)
VDIPDRTGAAGPHLFCCDRRHPGIPDGGFCVRHNPHNASIWNTIGAAIGDVGSFLFGALLGIAALRTERRQILCDPEVYSILCLSAGLGFVMSGYIKALYMQGMIEFFAQSGYSTSFLKFIMTIEVLGGIGLLISWTVLPAIAGLSVDMFGAIYTHIYNGDPLNDSTGAIGALIRFSAIVALWAWRPRSDDVEGSVRRRFVAAGLGMALCLSTAVAGSALIRRFSPPPAAQKSSARVLGDPDFRQAASSRTYQVVEVAFGRRPRQKRSCVSSAL